MHYLPKTIFCDIDGTLIRHSEDICSQHSPNSVPLADCVLPNTLETIRQWVKLGYSIILVTGRKESTRKATEKQLSVLNIIYDQLIMGIGGGDRVLINDKKSNSTRNTAYAINVNRNTGLYPLVYESEYVVVDDVDHESSKKEKPWGGEELIECNDKYVMKKLFMKTGECCSLQYHVLKKETVYVLSGKIKLYIGPDKNNLEERVMGPGDTVTINPLTVHRMEGIEDSYYLEASTNETWDVVRLHDKYNRS